ncbi:unnamed protein product [Ilex paraguariensis]|uniref:Auxin-responsive protein n=1 Tax=Ilex paraguariensis TaxID=185542 RepID=A0ABC8SBV2_9AQUA
MVRNGSSLESKTSVKNKPSFAEDFENCGVGTETLPLLLWNDQPNEEEDDLRRQKRITSDTNRECGEINDHLVGWPPIKSWRRKLLHEHQGGRIANHRTAERGNGGTKSMYVKVKMEGVGIGRKIDPRQYHSYQTLSNSLINMFVKNPKCEEDGAHYTLLYQDREGDWLLAGDIPWQNFIEVVQRMKILRNAG